MISKELEKIHQSGTQYINKKWYLQEIYFKKICRINQMQYIAQATKIDKMELLKDYNYGI